MVCVISVLAYDCFGLIGCCCLLLWFIVVGYVIVVGRFMAVV